MWTNPKIIMLQRTQWDLSSTIPPVWGPSRSKTNLWLSGRLWLGWEEGDGGTRKLKWKCSISRETVVVYTFVKIHLAVHLCLYRMGVIPHWTNLTGKNLGGSQPGMSQGMKRCFWQITCETAAGLSETHRQSFLPCAEPASSYSINGRKALPSLIPRLVVAGLNRSPENMGLDRHRYRYI